ncbi:MAG TPA: DUF4864 domain-containing protein [Abditibacteriaceae bacterium]|jgi:hypothetical protein
MKRWHIIVIALVAGSWIASGAFWTVRENRRNAELEAQSPGMGPNDSWRRATNEERAAVVQVINKQLNAFKRRDFKTALLLQSTTLRANFSSPEKFERMMLSSYPDFCNFKSADYGRGRIHPSNNRVAMRVTISTERGEQLSSIYQLVQENDTWRIDGVSTGQWPGAPQNSPNVRSRDRGSRDARPQPNPTTPAIGA